jgi:protein SCO1/2
MDNMQRGILKTVLIVVALIALVVTAFVYTMSQPRIMSVKELVNNGAITFEEPKAIEDFQLVAHNGEAFTRDDLKGNWTLLFFGFTHCDGFCPATLALLNSLYGQLEPKVRQQTQVVMVSVDPARDTPELLANYIPRFNPAFVGVTGDFLPIKLLSNQLYIGFQKSAVHGDHYEVDHGEQIVLINPQGEYHGFFKPPFTLARLKTTYQSIVISN